MGPFGPRPDQQGSGQLKQCPYIMNSKELVILEFEGIKIQFQRISQIRILILLH